MRSNTDAVVSSLKVAALINGINIVPSLAAFVVFGTHPLDTFGLLLLIEGAFVLLVRGAAELTGSAGTRKITSLMLSRSISRRKVTPVKAEEEKSDGGNANAAFYMLIGVLLFVESLILAALATPIP